MNRLHFARKGDAGRRIAKICLQSLLCGLRCRDMTEKRELPLRPDPRLDVVLAAKGQQTHAQPEQEQLGWLLRRCGPSTATRRAGRMGLTSGATSYHLRQLGAAGFVAEDTERGNARERWWRAVPRGTWLTDVDLFF